MKTYEIKVSDKFDFDKLDPVLSQVLTIEKSLNAMEKTEIILDINETNYLSVLGALVIFEMGDRFTKKGCRCVIRCNKTQASTPMMLLHLLGVTKRPQKSQAFQEFIKSNVVQVQRCRNLNDCAVAVNDKIIPLIKNKFSPSDKALKAINWTLWEAIDNSIAHGYKFTGGTNDFEAPIYACAYTFDKFIDVGILDIGQGIKSSLIASGKPKYHGLNDEEALKIAIKKGESGRIGGSTGLGLFGCAEIAKQSDGELIIISGERYLYLSEKRQSIKKCLGFNGTIVQLTVPRKFELDLNEIFGKNIEISPGDFGWLTGTVS